MGACLYINYIKRGLKGGRMAVVIPVGTRMATTVVLLFAYFRTVATNVRRKP